MIDRFPLATMVLLHDEAPSLGMLGPVLYLFKRRHGFDIEPTVFTRDVQHARDWATPGAHLSPHLRAWRVSQGIELP